MRLTRTFTTLAMAIAVTAALSAQNVAIKLATVAPANSSWQKALLDLGNTWSTSTEKRVSLTVFDGGGQGDEATVIRRMRVDQLQGGLLMISGLSEIDDAFNIFGMPFFFKDDAEAIHVRTQLTPTLEKRLEAKGFKFLAWGSGGWVQLFSKMPIKTLDEVKKAKLYTNKGDDRMVNWYKNNGFNAVGLTENDIVTQLKNPNGMINATPMPAYPASVLGVFRDAKFMLDIRVAPFTGAIIVTNAAWNKISAGDRTKLIESAKVFEKRMDTESPVLDASSVKEMRARGLTVTALDGKASAEFQAAADKLMASSKGTMVPNEIFDQAVQARDAFRKTKK